MLLWSKVPRNHLFVNGKAKVPLQSERLGQVILANFSEAMFDLPSLTPLWIRTYCSTIDVARLHKLINAFLISYLLNSGFGNSFCSIKSETWIRWFLFLQGLRSPFFYYVPPWIYIKQVTLLQLRSPLLRMRIEGQANGSDWSCSTAYTGFITLFIEQTRGTSQGDIHFYSIYIFFLRGLLQYICCTVNGQTVIACSFFFAWCLDYVYIDYRGVARVEDLWNCHVAQYLSFMRVTSFVALFVHCIVQYWVTLHSSKLLRVVLLAYFQSIAASFLVALAICMVVVEKWGMTAKATNWPYLRWRAGCC